MRQKFVLPPCYSRIDCQEKTGIILRMREHASLWGRAPFDFVAFCQSLVIYTKKNHKLTYRLCWRNYNYRFISTNNLLCLFFYFGQIIEEHNFWAPGRKLHVRPFVVILAFTEGEKKISLFLLFYRLYCWYYDNGILESRLYGQSSRMEMGIYSVFAAAKKIGSFII